PLDLSRQPLSALEPREPKPPRDTKAGVRIDLSRPPVDSRGSDAAGTLESNADRQTREDGTDDGGMHSRISLLRHSAGGSGGGKNMGASAEGTEGAPGGEQVTT